MGSSSHLKARRHYSSHLSLFLPLPLFLLLLSFQLPPAPCLAGADRKTKELTPFKVTDKETAWGTPGRKASHELSTAQGAGMASGLSLLVGALDSRADSNVDSAVQSTAESVFDDTVRRTSGTATGSNAKSSLNDELSGKGSGVRDESAPWSGVRAVLSEVGLRYAKDVMVTQVLNEIIPLTVPDLSLDMVTPLGPITVNLSNIVLWNARVPDSALLLDEDSGSITLYAGNADANLSASWSFSFDTYLHDHGNATVDMEGLHVVAVGNLTELEGGLVVGVEEVGCAIDRLQISLHSPYSWIYNWLEARLPNHLRAAVQSQVEWSVLTIVEELNEFLRDLPRAIPVDCSSDLDVTVPYDPVIKSGALLLDCIGQFQESNASCTPARTSRYRTINTALEDPIVKGEEPRGLRGGDIRLQFWGPQAEGLTRVRGLHCSKGGRRTTVAAQDLPELSLLGRARAALRNKPESGPSADPALTMVIDLDQSGGASRATVAHRLHELSPSKDPGRGLPANPGAGLSSCPGPVRMLTLKVLQEVIDSAIQVYYETGALSFTLSKLPSSFPFQLNTRSWRYLLPSLYRQYPSTDMELSFVAASVPNVKLSQAVGIDAAVKASFFLSVVLDQGPKDVLCIDIALHFSALAGLRGNNLTANARLVDISVDLKWSTVGSISPALLEGITRALTKIVLLPLLNYRLADGFPLPSLPGVAFCNASVVYHASFLEICTDLEYTGGIFGLPPATSQM